MGHVLSPLILRTAVVSQTRGLPVPMSRVWYGLLAEPWVKSLNTRQAQSLVSLQCTFPVSGSLQVGVLSARNFIHISMLNRFSWHFAGLKVTSCTELSSLLRTGHEQAVEIQMTGPPRAGISSVLWKLVSLLQCYTTPTDARRELGPFSLLYIA